MFLHTYVHFVIIERRQPQVNINTSGGRVEGREVQWQGKNNPKH